PFSVTSSTTTGSWRTSAPRWPRSSAPWARRCFRERTCGGASVSGRAKVLAGVLAVVLLVTAAIVLRRPGGSPAADPPGGDDMGGMEGTQEAGGADHAQMPGMGGGDASVRLTPGDISTFGITFGNAEVRRLSKTIRAVGMVEFDETRITHVAPKFGGWAERLH